MWQDILPTRKFEIPRGNTPHRETLRLCQVWTEIQAQAVAQTAHEMCAFGQTPPVRDLWEIFFPNHGLEVPRRPTPDRETF